MMGGDRNVSGNGKVFPAAHLFLWTLSAAHTIPPRTQ
jgi:hypothetical protein